MSLSCPSASERVGHITMLLSEQIGVNFYDFAAVLSERENLDTLDEPIFNILAGHVVRLSSLFRERDIRVISDRNKQPDKTKKELDIIANYLGTLLVRQLFKHHETMLAKVIEVLTNTVQIWDHNFRILLNLIILFDFARENQDYRDLVLPLAQTCTELIHSYFKEGVQYESHRRI